VRFDDGVFGEGAEAFELLNGMAGKTLGLRSARKEELPRGELVLRGAHTSIQGVARWRVNLTRISHRLSTAGRDKAVSTSLRLVTVLDVLFKYASAR
jgi:hypothetical protein